MSVMYFLSIVVLVLLYYILLIWVDICQIFSNHFPIFFWLGRRVKSADIFLPIFFFGLFNCSSSLYSTWCIVSQIGSNCFLGQFSLCCFSLLHLSLDQGLFRQLGVDWFDLVLWHINHCSLLNDKSFLYTYFGEIDPRHHKFWLSVEF